MKYIALFFTHSGAVSFNKILKKEGLETQLSPIPRKLSSSCGIGVRFFSEKNINDYITEDVEKIYKVESDECYSLSYQCE